MKKNPDIIWPTLDLETTENPVEKNLSCYVWKIADILLNIDEKTYSSSIRDVTKMIFKISQIYNRNPTTALYIVKEQILHVIKPFIELEAMKEQLGWYKIWDTMANILQEQIDGLLPKLEPYKKNIPDIIAKHQKLLDRISSGRIYEPLASINNEMAWYWEIYGVRMIGSIDTKSKMYIDMVAFSILLENLFSNYQKFGEKGECVYALHWDELDISLENTKKELRSQPLSSKQGKRIMRDIVESLWWKIIIEDNPDSFKVSVTGLKLKRTLKEA